MQTTTEAVTEAKAIAQPFLRWAGGKRSLLPELLPRVPEFSGIYLEPFVGGGAMFYALSPERSLLSDSNPELINAYRMVRDQLPELLSLLNAMKNEKVYYYAVREADRLQGWQGTEDVQRAARFIYLNRTCFNGLHRTNKAGQFNVPFGKYKNPKICDRVGLTAASQALQGVELVCSDFTVSLATATEDDFVYLDPPYVPVSANSFVGYGAEGFDEQQQLTLSAWCRRLTVRGVRFMLSNSGCAAVWEMYEGLGFRVERVECRRNINSKGDGRGKVGEVIVRNY